MPESKKKVRRYDADTGSPLDGLNLVQQHAAHPAPGDSKNRPQRRHVPAQDNTLEPELIRRLIKFFEAIQD